MTSCGHCGSDREVHGWANGVPLCHPNTGMDCYRLVTVYREPVGARLPGGMLHGKADPITHPELTDTLIWDQFARDAAYEPPPCAVCDMVDNSPICACDCHSAGPDYFQIAYGNALKMAGCSYEELERQAKAGDFETFNARLAWMVVKP